MNPDIATAWGAKQSVSFSWLTNAQVRDCYNADRSPRTGRRLRSSMPTRLERLSKVNNWNKLMVKGAAINLTKVAYDLQITNEQDLLSLTKAISKIETILLNKLSELYEAQKAYELNERAKWETQGWKKTGDDFVKQHLLVNPPLAEK